MSSASADLCLGPVQTSACCTTGLENIQSKQTESERPERRRESKRRLQTYKRPICATRVYIQVIGERVERARQNQKDFHEQNTRTVKKRITREDSRRRMKREHAQGSSPVFLSTSVRFFLSRWVCALQSAWLVPCL